MQIHIEERVPLKAYTTLGIGGYAEYFVNVLTRDEVKEAIVWARSRNLPWRVMGGGSNIYFSDTCIQGLTIHNSIQGVRTETTAEGVRVLCGAGEMLDAVVAQTCAEGWWGLENLSAIPGTVGATPVQNVGAYGVEVADVIESVTVYDAETDSFRAFTNAECQFAYRHSCFKETAGKRYVITEVTFLVSGARTPVLSYKDLAPFAREHEARSLTPLTVRVAVTDIRAKKFPNWRELGTAGSFFKNPTISEAQFLSLRAQFPELPGHYTKDGAVKIALGWVLEHICALRGHREGNVGTFPAQALVVVNYGGASADELTRFAEKISACVKEKTLIAIEKEVTFIA